MGGTEQKPWHCLSWALSLTVPLSCLNCFLILCSWVELQPSVRPLDKQGLFHPGHTRQLPRGLRLLRGPNPSSTPTPVFSAANRRVGVERNLREEIGELLKAPRAGSGDHTSCIPGPTLGVFSSVTPGSWARWPLHWPWHPGGHPGGHPGCIRGWKGTHSDCRSERWAVHEGPGVDEGPSLL